MAGLGNNVGTQFNLTARMMGDITVAGQNYTAWFFTDGTPMFGRGFMGDRYLPSAHIECIEGRLITINFDNRSMMEHTIHLHGLDVDQANDGVPTTSFAVPGMGSATYQFKAPHAGTYHYHCHVDTVIHYARGMHGTVIVRPPNGRTDVAWDGGPGFDEEVLWQLSTIDTSWMALDTSGPGTARFRPNGFLLNGYESAAAQADPFSRVTIQQGQTAMIRLMNASYHWAKVQLGSLTFQVIAADGRPMLGVVNAQEWELGPGERYDLLLPGQSAGQWLASIDYLDDRTGAVLGSCGTQISVL